MEHSRDHLSSGLGVFLLLLLAGTARAGLCTFDNLLSGETLSDYVSRMCGFGVTVNSAAIYPDGSRDPSDPLPNLGSDNYLADAGVLPGEPGGDSHSFTITFSVPITSLSFDWARELDTFKVEATYGDTSLQVLSITSGKSGGGSGWGHETIDLLDPDIFGGPVTSLFFHDGGEGAIGIDNLAVVSVVPLPASILLGAFAVGLAGRKLRQFV
jgi:hypothetical protein